MVITVIAVITGITIISVIRVAVRVSVRVSVRVIKFMQRACGYGTEMVAVSGGVAIVAWSSDRVYILTWSCLRRRCGGRHGGVGRRSYIDIREICLSLSERNVSRKKGFRMQYIQSFIS